MIFDQLPKKNLLQQWLAKGIRNESTFSENIGHLNLSFMWFSALEIIINFSFTIMLKSTSELHVKFPRFP